MAYAPRYYMIEDGCAFHVTWQCHNFDWLLASDWAKKMYYDLLLKYKKRYDVKFYSYSFMSNHPHLTGVMNSREDFSAFFRIVNSQFARAINRKYKRRGQVVMDRFRSPMIGDGYSHLKVMIYGDLNQVRADMVKHPEEYQWSSYAYYAHGKEDPLITPAPSYEELGKTPEDRQLKYREMVDELFRREGYKKQNYSITPFIGNPDWVIKKHRELKEKMNLKRQAYLLRQRKHISQFY